MTPERAAFDSAARSGEVAVAEKELEERMPFERRILARTPCSDGYRDGGPVRSATRVKSGSVAAPG